MMANQTLHGATINGCGGALHESVARTKMKNFILDTSAVEGRPWAYETAISHVDYNNGDWIAVVSAETAEEAAASHEDFLINHLSDRDRVFEDIYSGKEYERGQSVISGQ